VFLVLVVLRTIRDSIVYIVIFIVVMDNFFEKSEKKISFYLNGLVMGCLAVIMYYRISILANVKSIRNS
jgi:hypothetical protein